MPYVSTRFSSFIPDMLGLPQHLCRRADDRHPGVPAGPHPVQPPLAADGPGAGSLPGNARLRLQPRHRTAPTGECRPPCPVCRAGLRGRRPGQQNALHRRLGGHRNGCLEVSGYQSHCHGASQHPMWQGPSKNCLSGRKRLLSPEGRPPVSSMIMEPSAGDCIINAGQEVSREKQRHYFRRLDKRPDP